MGAPEVAKCDMNVPVSKENSQFHQILKLGRGVEGKWFQKK